MRPRSRLVSAPLEQSGFLPLPSLPRLGCSRWVGSPPRCPARRGARSFQAARPGGTKRSPQRLTGNCEWIPWPARLKLDHAHKIAITITVAACVRHRFRDRPRLRAPSPQEAHRLLLPLSERPHKPRGRRTRRTGSPLPRHGRRRYATQAGGARIGIIAAQRKGLAKRCRRRLPGAIGSRAEGTGSRSPSSYGGEPAGG